MEYALYLAIMLPFQLLLVTAALFFIRKRTFGAESGSWLRLLLKVFVLMTVISVLSLIPGIGFVALVVWLVGLKRLSGLDVIPTFILSFSMGVIVFAAMIILARQLNVPLVGHDFGG